MAFFSNGNVVGIPADASYEIYLYNNGPISQITTSTSSPFNGNTSPVINANGTRIAFHSPLNLTGQNTDGNSEIFLAQIGGGISQITHTTLGDSAASFLPTISGDGTRIGYVSGFVLYLYTLSTASPPSSPAASASRFTPVPTTSATMTALMNYS